MKKSSCYLVLTVVGFFLAYAISCGIEKRLQFLTFENVLGLAISAVLSAIIGLSCFIKYKATKEEENQEAL